VIKNNFDQIIAKLKQQSESERRESTKDRQVRIVQE